MSYHVISIDRPGYLSVDNARLKIEFPEEDEPHFIPFMDIALLILNHQQITLTKSVMQALAEAGGVLIASDQKHLPINLALPLGINNQGAKRPWQQAKLIASEEGKKIMASHHSCQNHITSQSIKAVQDER